MYMSDYISIQYSIQCFDSSILKRLYSYYFEQGMSILYPYLGKRVVSVTKEDLIVVLSQENPYLTKLCVETKESLEKLGACVFNIAFYMLPFSLNYN